MRLPVIVIPLVASLARADVATWFWTVSDTGDRDGLIEPGESALLTLAVAFDPPQPQYGGMFASAGFYDILGNAPWAAGRLEEFNNLIDDLGTPGIPDDDNNIIGVENFQFPEGFGYGSDESNPINLYFIRWTPATYEPATVTLDNGGPDAWIYTDPNGNRLLYAGQGGAVSFAVVPAPPTAFLLLAPLGLTMRRRR